MRELAADISAAYDRRLARDLPESDDEPSSRSEPEKALFTRPIPFALVATPPAMGRHAAV
jgi:hypothetical protein